MSNLPSQIESGFDELVRRVEEARDIDVEIDTDKGPSKIPESGELPYPTRSPRDTVRSVRVGLPASTTRFTGTTVFP